MTKKGEERKKRIYGKLWGMKDMTVLIIQQYLVVFPMFKSFVLVFEQKTPQIHKTHDKLVEVFRNFLAFFMKYEKIRNIRSKKLKCIKIDDSSIRDVETFFYGGKNERLMKEMCTKKRNVITARFRSTLKMPMLIQHVTCNRSIQ